MIRMNDDILIPNPDTQLPVDTDITSSPEGEGEVSRGEQVFDISEDNISPIKEESEPLPGQTFQLKKVLPKIPVAPKIVATTMAPQVNMTPIPTPKAPSAIPTVPPKVTTEPKTSAPIPINLPTEPSTATESPTKNVLDPNYVAPGVFATKSAPVVKPTPKIKLPPLPEIPAFKGTFDAKPHNFTPSAPKSTTPPTLQQNFPNTTPVEGGMGAVTPSAPSTASKVETSSMSPSSTPPPSQPPPKPSAGGPTLTKPTTPMMPGQPKPFVSAFGNPANMPPVSPSPSPSPFVRNPNSPANPATKTLGGRSLVQQTSKIQAPEKTDLKNLRTYESDVAEILAHKQVSKASIAIAADTQKKTSEMEAEAGDSEQTETTPTSSHNTLKLILILLSAFFIGAGLFGAYYLYSKSVFVPLPSQNPQQQQDPGVVASDIIPVDTQSRVDVRGLASQAAIQKIRAEIEMPRDPGTIHELVITDGNTQVSSSDMLARIAIEVPDILARSFEPLWTLGIYTTPTGERDVFVIGTTQFFQNTFAGMLQWERLKVDELKPFHPTTARETISAPTETPTGTSTIATSTIPAPVETSTYFTIRGSFEDRIIQNKDVRVFRTVPGDTLFLYSFINNKTLLMAGKEGTIIEILDRLENRAFVR